MEDWGGIGVFLGSVPGTVPLAAIVTFFLFQIGRQKLVGSKHVDDVRKDRDDRLAEQKAQFEARDAEREAHMEDMIRETGRREATKDETIATQTEIIRTLLSQNGELKELAHTTVSLLNALPTTQSGDGLPKEAHGNG